MTTTAAWVSPREGYRMLTDPIEVRDVSGNSQPTISGHLSVFNEWARISSMVEGTFMERIAPGAFTKTISENRSRMQMLFNHGQDVLGKQVIASITELREDDTGAYYEGQLLDGVPDLIVSGLRAGRYGSSFQFQVVRADETPRPRSSDYNPSGLPERTIREVKMPEFGPVTFPAYAGADARVRSITDEVLLKDLATDPERRDQFATFLKRFAPSADAAQSRTSGPERREAPKFKNREEFLSWIRSI